MSVMNLNWEQYSTAQKASGLVAEWHNEDMVERFPFTQSIDAVYADGEQEVIALHATYCITK